MGELSKKIGIKLENFGDSFFKNFNWELKTQDYEIKCLNNNHKNSKNNPKTTHGIDLLFKYFNPFNNRNEAVIIECKNRQWHEYTAANLTKWVEELLNTIECSSCSQETSLLLEDCVLTSGILLFNCNDNKFDKSKADITKAQIVIPRRKNPVILYLADNDRLEKLYSLSKIITEIKSRSIDEFGIIYPSIDSNWAKRDVIIPEFLFSDYISTWHSEKRKIDTSTERKYEIKSIFCFDKVSNNACLYLKEMIKTMQLGAYNSSDCEICVYWYPQMEQDIEIIKSFNSNSENYKFVPMDNRNISRVEYGN